MKFRKFNKILKWIPLFASIILLSGCDAALLDPKGQIGVEQRSLILITFSLMLIVVIPAILMAIIFTWKYRVSNNKYAIYSPNWSHSNKIETFIWAVPVLIIMVLAILTWNTTHSLDPGNPLISNKKPLTIEVVSMDWKWLFIYPEQDIATVNEIVFPINTPVKFKLTSNSVMNSFFIPRLGSQIYTMAGMQTNLHLIANTPGIYNGISASYSGSGFSGMKFKAIVTPDYAEFEQWVIKAKRSSSTISNISEFENLAIPSKYNKVEYFSSVKSDLFREIMKKFIDHSTPGNNIIYL